MKILYRILGIVIMVVPLHLTFSASGVSGCGSTGDGSGGSGGSVSAGTGTGDAIQDTLTTLDTLLMVASTSLNVSSSAVLAVDQHVHCPSGAQASVTGDNTADGPFDVVIVMNNCEGVTGTTNHAGSSVTGADSREFTGGFTESVGGNGCILSLTDLDFSFSVPLDTIVAPTSETVTGALTATCTESGSEASVTCDFTGGIDAQSTSALTAACSCIGSGCGS